MKKAAVALALLLGAPGVAGPGVEPVVRGIEARYHAARTLKATFLELYREGHEDVRVESGTVYFSRPGRMRWEYEEPEQKLFLVDGTNVWFYVPADRTVTRARVKESEDWRTPLGLLVGKLKLSRVCGRIEMIPSGRTPALGQGATATGHVVLRCVARRAPSETRQGNSGSITPSATSYPAEESSFREALLEVDPGYRLVRVVIREPAGIETEFRFGKWQENIPLPEALFHFQAPSGVAIVHEASSAPQAP